MIYLATGVALWIAAHFFKRVLPGVRAALGDVGKGLVALLIVASVVLMVIGYRQGHGISLYDPVTGMRPVNNLAMLLAVFLSGAGSVKGQVAAMIRHPMLWGMVVWSAAHLLVRGDIESVLLFGGLGLWALAQMQLINHFDGKWQRPVPGPWARDAKNLLITLIVYAVISGLHILLGPNPFTGAFG